MAGKAGRAMSLRDAERCEQGIGVRCRCRCRGTLHGKKRFGDTPTFADFSKLDKSDPHFVPYTLANKRRFGTIPLPFERAPEATSARH